MASQPSSSDHFPVAELTVRTAQSDLLEVDPLDFGPDAPATAALASTHEGVWQCRPAVTSSGTLHPTARDPAPEAAPSFTGPLHQPRTGIPAGTDEMLLSVISFRMAPRGAGPTYRASTRQRSSTQSAPPAANHLGHSRTATLIYHSGRPSTAGRPATSLLLRTRRRPQRKAGC